MIKILIKKFIKDYDKTTDKKVREHYGILGGVLGIICNIFLFIVKLSIGLIMNSIAIISDSVNNLSDTGSSFVAVVGAKLSNRRPDKEHPFGHGRIEYISSLIISFIIMIVGFELLRTSFEKIFNPEPVKFNLILIIILGLAIFVKVWMFSYNRYLGNKINSIILKATSKDSLNDVISTGVVILSTIIGQFVSFPLDGIMGLGVSLFVMLSGFNIAKDTVGILLGNPPSKELVNEISTAVTSGNGIIGIHDLIVHDYGPGRIMATAHAEVPDNINIVKIHEVIDGIEQHVLKEHGINLVLHMDPICINNEKTMLIQKLVAITVHQVNPIFTIHDFRLVDGDDKINLIFDLVVPYEMKQSEQDLAILDISARLYNANSRYNTIINIDNQY